MANDDFVIVLTSGRWATRSTWYLKTNRTLVFCTVKPEPERKNMVKHVWLCVRMGSWPSHSPAVDGSTGHPAPCSRSAAAFLSSTRSDMTIPKNWE